MFIQSVYRDAKCLIRVNIFSTNDLLGQVRLDQASVFETLFKEMRS